MSLNSTLILNGNGIFSIRMQNKKNNQFLSNFETINEKNHAFQNDFVNIQISGNIIFSAQNNSTNKSLMIAVKTKIQNKLIKVEIFMNRRLFEILKKSFHLVKKRTVNKIPHKAIQEIVLKDVNYANVSMNIRTVLRILQEFDQFAQKKRFFADIEFEEISNDNQFT